MIISFDDKAKTTYDMVKTLKESVQRALDETEDSFGGRLEALERGLNNIADSTDGVAVTGNMQASGNVITNNHTGHIGEVVDGWLTADKSIENSTYTDLLYIELDKGVWLLSCGLRFASNATGRRMGNVAVTAGEAGYQVSYPAVNGYQTQIRFTHIVTVTEDGKKFYLNAWQNSGSEMTMPATGSGYGNFIRAIRIS